MPAMTDPIDVPIRLVLPPSVADFLDGLRSFDYPAARVADLDGLADVADRAEGDAPEVVGIRVTTAGGTSRWFARARGWSTCPLDGGLHVEDEHGDDLAEFVGGAWVSVEAVHAESAEVAG